MRKMKINNNQIKAKDLEMSAVGMISEDVVLKSVRISFQYDSENKPTDIVESIKYDCVDPETYSNFTVKVNATKPIISNDEIEESEDAVWVHIPVEETIIRPYAMDYGVAKVSIVAPFVKLAEN